MFELRLNDIAIGRYETEAGAQKGIDAEIALGGGPREDYTILKV